VSNEKFGRNNEGGEPDRRNLKKAAALERKLRGRGSVKVKAVGGSKKPPRTIDG